MENAEKHKVLDFWRIFRHQAHFWFILCAKPREKALETETALQRSDLSMYTRYNRFWLLQA
jgi:hypothetical protein